MTEPLSDAKLTELSKLHPYYEKSVMAKELIEARAKLARVREIVERPGPVNVLRGAGNLVRDIEEALNG